MTDHRPHRGSSQAGDKYRFMMTIGDESPSTQALPLGVICDMITVYRDLRHGCTLRHASRILSVGLRSSLIATHIPPPSPAQGALTVTKSVYGARRLAPPCSIYGLVLVNTMNLMSHFSMLGSFIHASVLGRVCVL